MSEITFDDWVNWKKHPVTQYIVEGLYNKREAIKEGMAEGQSETEFIQRQIGRAMSLKDAIDFILKDAVDKPVDPEEDTNDNSSNRT